MKAEDLLMPVKIGDKVEIKNSTTSLRSGQKVEVLGFVDDDPKKPICEGCLPGGWVDPKHIKRKPPQVRMMTFLEIILEYGKPGEAIKKLDHHFATSYRDGRKVTMEEQHPVDIVGEDMELIPGFKVHNEEYVGVVSVRDLALASTPVPKGDEFTLRPAKNLVFLFDMGGPDLHTKWTETMRKRLDTQKWKGAASINDLLHTVVFRRGSYSISTNHREGEVHAMLTTNLHLDCFELYKGEECVWAAPQNIMISATVQLLPNKA